MSPPWRPRGPCGSALRREAAGPLPCGCRENKRGDEPSLARSAPCTSTMPAGHSQRPRTFSGPQVLSLLRPDGRVSVEHLSGWPAGVFSALGLLRGGNGVSDPNTHTHSPSLAWFSLEPLHDPMKQARQVISTCHRRKLRPREGLWSGVTKKIGAEVWVLSHLLTEIEIRVGGCAPLPESGAPSWSRAFPGPPWGPLPEWTSQPGPPCLSLGSQAVPGGPGNSLLGPLHGRHLAL